MTGSRLSQEWDQFNSVRQPEVARRLAHEIKNPLTPIQLAVQELASKYKGDDAHFQRLLDTASEILRDLIARKL